MGNYLDKPDVEKSTESVIVRQNGALDADWNVSATRSVLRPLLACVTSLEG